MTELNTKFEQRRGLWMVLRRHSPWRREELDRVQVGMLQACSIPGILPMAVEELDGEIRLRYRLTGCKMLSQALRTERWTMTDAMAALCKLAETAEQCHDHMLDFRSLLLKDDYIFVGDGWHDLRFAYLPIAASGEDDDGADIERLIVRWLMRTEDPDGKTMQRLLEMTASKKFVPSALRDFARRYLCERAEERAGSIGAITHPGIGFGHLRESQVPVASAIHANNDPRADQPGINPRDSWAASSPAKPTIRKRDEADGSSWHRLGAEPAASVQRQGSSDAVREEEPRRIYGIPAGMSVVRWRVWLAALAAVAAGIAWKILYVDASGTPGLALSLGATAACVGLCLYLWNGWPPKGGGEAKRDMEIPPAVPSAIQAPAISAQDELPAWPVRLNQRDEGGSVREAGASARFEPFGGTARQDGGDEEAQIGEEGEPRPQTEWLPARRDATELLQAAMPAKPVECYLEWESADRPCRVALQADSVIIGRSREAAQHVDESSGVSRAHLEMLRQQGGWAAKDLGSRNGSWLNGQPMAPYEAYPLAAGDCLQMAGSIYRFHASG
ncbi:DUF6382 domain-containing protein [Cohnella sp. JJ-181]|uniref:DUF6382 domain-containing protein n=1 Tax=Cohnella rhizoplanae TaxID=2974897 RepID=UPI0022FF8079|nr:DUF6382 domain-containing protein [Cohnella sp. JJ-181]CAI6079132.1 hypothetical protein COHCIP112018_02722 [Cohnella sp. JJ-181]